MAQQSSSRAKTFTAQHARCTIKRLSQCAARLQPAWGFAGEEE